MTESLYDFFADGRSYMLSQCSDNISALFGPSTVLNQLVNKLLSRLAAALALVVGDLNEGPINVVDRERLWCRKSETRPFLRFKSDIACVSMLLIQCSQSFITQFAGKLQASIYAGVSDPEFQRDVGRRNRVGSKPHLCVPDLVYDAARRGRVTLTAGSRLSGSASMSKRRKLTNVSTILIRLCVLLTRMKHLVNSA